MTPNRDLAWASVVDDGGTLVTADDFAPWTDKNLPGGGLITEIVDQSMKKAEAKPDFGIYIVNDWASHLNPLVGDAVLDLGYPWYLPDCQSSPDNWRCQNLHYSEPMFGTLILLFTAKGRPMAFEKDEDMNGKTLCRPKGYFTHDLEKNGRF